MIGIVPFRGAAMMPVDPDWLALWSDDFPDARLCEAMLADDRLGSRISAIILNRMDVGGDIAPRPGGQAGLQLRRFMAMPRDTLLRVLGLLWKAPVLASVLPSPQARERHGLQSRAQLDIVLAYRDHAPAETVGPLDPAKAFEADGALCLYAWIAQFEPGLQDRLLLSLPFCEGDLDAREARVALTARVLLDDAVPDALAS